MTTPSSMDAVQVRLDYMSAEISRQADALASVADSLKVLIRLEQAHSHMLDEQGKQSKVIGDHETRLREVERSIPPLLEIRRWVVAMVLAVVAGVGLTLFNMVVPEKPEVHIPGARK